MSGERVELIVREATADELTPYERLLGDAIRGDSMLFVREDSVEAARSVVDPVFESATPLHEYDPNTWGPIEVNRLIAGPWRNPKPIADKAMEAAK